MSSAIYNNNEKLDPIFRTVFSLAPPRYCPLNINFSFSLLSPRCFYLTIILPFLWKIWPFWNRLSAWVSVLKALFYCLFLSYNIHIIAKFYSQVEKMACNGGI